MASFSEIQHVTSYKLYKAALKIALAKVKPGTELPFVYLDKVKCDDGKERALVLLDFSPALLPTLPKKPTVTGKCKVNDADKFVFDHAEKMNLDKVGKLLSDAGVPRAVAHPGESDAASSAEPAPKLDLKYGWTEMRSWGDEAQALLDAFDGLVGAYKGLPEIKPEWADLSRRHGAVKVAVAKIVAEKVENNKAKREAKLIEVIALTREVRHLSTAAREEANKPKPPAKAVVPETTNPKPSMTPVKEEVSKQKTKPKFEVSDLKQFVKSTPALGARDSLEKYMVRARRVLEADFSGVSEDHLTAVSKLAEQTYFPSSTAATVTTAKPPQPATVAIDWEDRVLDLNGNKADLSNFNSTEKRRITDIPMTDGLSDHGKTRVGSTECLHWRLGDLRIFGNVADGHFTLIGTGRHSGKGNSNYKVDLQLGGTATASTM